jgi:hypothetical protein
MVTIVDQYLTIAEEEVTSEFPGVGSYAKRFSEKGEDQAVLPLSFGRVVHDIAVSKQWRREGEDSLTRSVKTAEWSCTVGSCQVRRGSRNCRPPGSRG